MLWWAIFLLFAISLAALGVAIGAYVQQKTGPAGPTGATGATGPEGPAGDPAAGVNITEGSNDHSVAFGTSTLNVISDIIVGGGGSLSGTITNNGTAFTVGEGANTRAYLLELTLKDSSASGTQTAIFSFAEPSIALGMSLLSGTAYDVDTLHCFTYSQWIIVPPSVTTITVSFAFTGGYAPATMAQQQFMMIQL